MYKVRFCPVPDSNPTGVYNLGYFDQSIFCRSAEAYAITWNEIQNLWRCLTALCNWIIFEELSTQNNRFILFQPWPEDALERVAHKALEHLDMDDTVREVTVQLFKYFHTSITPLAEKFARHLGRKTYVTPTSYLELIDSFRRLLNKKQDETMRARMR